MRSVINLNQSWLFAKTAEIPTVLNTDWETVNLPHTWNAQDGQDGGGDYYRGIGMYQIDLPDPAPGKQIGRAHV